MKPLVSVIIPVYNSEEYLLETIESVNSQEYSPVEIIVVNNCSTNDSTLKVLSELAGKVKIVESEIKGLANARNDGIKEARGTYILPLDSDDLLDKSFIKKCVEQFELNNNLNLVRTYIKLFGAKKGVVEFEDYDFAKLLARNLMVATSMFKKIDWERVGGYDGNFLVAFEDWEFWINILKDGGEVATIKEPLFLYRIQRNSMMRSLKFNQLLKIRRQLWEKHKTLYGQHFVNPTETFEYKHIADSKANKLGSLLLSPFSKFKLMQ